MEDELDITKLKYVLYARKSTEDETRQVKSIEDQIEECKIFANRVGITFVDILQESKSAKRPNNRPIFRQMLDDLKKGIEDRVIELEQEKEELNGKLNELRIS